MDTGLLALNLQTAIRQRNSLLVIAALFLVSNLLLAFKVFNSKKEVVIMPYIEKEVSIGNRPSESYMAMMSDIYLNDLLNLSPGNIQFKRSRILKHTCGKSWNELNNYFQKLQEQYTKYNISTYFTVKTLDIDSKNLKASVKGILNSNFGTKGREEKEASYLLEYTFKGGILMLSKFVEVPK